ncbi:hypothetical protein FH972_017292 [Carpinus fangiana]|uniref:Copper transport protein n=1 Tax=Carpinus fangiana TaxID=176857 RepID=A0A5N6RIS2_9ROSI|nr:hypothetical protein FH972_017292 [Carpinus fangiana]
MSREHDHVARMDMDMDMGMTPPDSMSSGSMNMTIPMSFYWGKAAIVLFSGWPDQKLGMYVLSLFFVFLLALAVEVLSILPGVKPGTNPILGGLTQATVYAFRMGLAYLVMLSVMSFNLGIFIAAVAGHAVGFFIIKARALATAERGETVTFPTGITRKV